MTKLADEFIRYPLAHRGFHDIAAGRSENSIAAFQAAIDSGYGIELDVQNSADNVAMVFHDYELGRLTSQTGLVRQHDAADLGKIELPGGAECIPTLAEAFDAVAGKVPLLIEIKDQDGALGQNVGPLEQAIARDVAAYQGPVAVMSYNPHSVAKMAGFLPDIAHGLTTSAFPIARWPMLSFARRRMLRNILDFERTGASFISHSASDLGNPRVAELRAGGTPVLCWTIKSKRAEIAARTVADNITFEGYRPTVSAA